MRSYFSILLILVAQGIMSSCTPQTLEFHKRLSKDQLKKYFHVNRHHEVPEYNFINIRLRKSVPSSASGIEPRTAKRGDESAGKDLFIAADSIFGHAIQMQLWRNGRLRAPSFKVSRIEDGDHEAELKDRSYGDCHYIGRNGTVSAALSACGDNSKGMSGILLLPDGGVYIQPVDQDLANLLGFSDIQERSGSRREKDDVLHLAYRPKRLSVPDERWEDEHYIPSAPRSEYELDDDDIMRYMDFDDLNSVSEVAGAEPPPPEKNDPVYKRNDGKKLFLELAVFLDQTGYEMFMPHVKSEDNLVDLLLGFVNQMQALYQSPSLKRKITISLVKMELMKKQPGDLPHADGERDILLDNFCKYQAKKNPDSDNDPNHWDIALYISGLNFYSMEKGKKNGVTMGLAPVGGVCMKKHSCVITEFGTTSDDGRPYPSAGLLSTYIAVHELGHNLGMLHDGPPNNKCPANGHVMSPSRGTKGETTWSSCSSEVLEKSDKKCLHDVPQAKTSKATDHSKYNEKPGQVWDAHDQCKVFLRDEDATLLNETVVSMCYSWISAFRKLESYIETMKRLYPFLNN